MNNTTSTSATAWQDRAIDGLFQGIAAGLAMAVYLLTAHWLSGARWLQQFADRQGGSLLDLALSHLAVSAFYAVVFHLLTYRLQIRNRLIWISTATLYGLGLALIALVIVFPSLGVSDSILPRQHLFLAHLLYGLILGYLSLRRQIQP